MKLKSILLTAVATISLATATMAQVPNYLPTNGIVGWWPFNGNANDESGNGNNGTVNGATLTSDRFMNVNKAYSFDGVNDFINCGNINAINGISELTISAWIQYNSIINSSRIFGKEETNNGTTGIAFNLDNFNGNNNALQGVIRNGNNSVAITGSILTPGLFYNVVMVFNGNGNLNSDRLKIFVNGNLVNSNFPNNIPSSTPVSSFDAWIGGTNPVSTDAPFDGKIDDIGIWNRALTQQEITNLYTATNCANNTAINPQTNSLTTSSTATFTTTTSDSNPSYVWQSDFGQGYVTLNNYGNYSGVNSATLNISNVQLANHNQPIRVISTSGDCIDTSNVAEINILDTCITNVTVYDTLLTTVTDTLIINATITGINPPNNLNTVKVFPNPASTHITIDYGNFNAMSGYTLTIVNSIGQTVFTTPVNQQTSYIDLSTWTGTGIYFVQLIDPQNNTIENRKIVIQ